MAISLLIPLLRGVAHSDGVCYPLPHFVTVFRWATRLPILPGYLVVLGRGMGFNMSTRRVDNGNIDELTGEPLQDGGFMTTYIDPIGENQETNIERLFAYPAFEYQE